MGQMIGEPGKCFICGRNGASDPLDRHHVFGASNRKKSEEYGLVVPLCHDRCHIFGKDAVHNNAAVNRLLKQEIQLRAMEENGWTVKDFIHIFGKSYL